MNDKQNNNRKVVRKLVIAGIWICLWQVLALVIANPVVFAGPLITVQTLAYLFFKQAFWYSLATTLVHVVVGFVTGLLIAVILAYGAHRHAFLKEFLQPFTSIVKATPVVCFVVILLVWLDSKATVAILVALVVFPQFYTAILEGASHPNKAAYDLVTTARITLATRFWTLWWPSVKGYIKAAVTLSISISWKAAVAAELIGVCAHSVGSALYDAKVLLEAPEIMAWTLVVVLCGFLSEKLGLYLLDKFEQAGYAYCLKYRMPAQQNSAATGVTLDSFTFAYPGQAPLYMDLNEVYAPCSFTYICKPSGWGKTTLLKLICGLLTPQKGSVRAGQIAYLPQTSYLLDELDAIQNVMLFAPQEVSRDQVQSALEEVLEPQLLTVPVAQLSGGQRRRVEVIRALLQEGDTIVLDEPFAGLDKDNAAKLFSLIKRSSTTKTVIVVGHAFEQTQNSNA